MFCLAHPHKKASYAGAKLYNTYINQLYTTAFLQISPYEFYYYYKNLFRSFACKLFR